MSAMKKAEQKDHLNDDLNKDTSGTAPLEDVSGADIPDAPDSPARRMQQHLKASIQPDQQRHGVLDTGRVLAAASGITTLLGVFIFSGIW